MELLEPKGKVRNCSLMLQIEKEMFGLWGIEGKTAKLLALILLVISGVGAGSSYREIFSGRVISPIF